MAKGRSVFGDGGSHNLPVAQYGGLCDAPQQRFPSCGGGKNAPAFGSHFGIVVIGRPYDILLWL